MGSVSETWRHAWRNGFAPVLSDECLDFLRRGLLEDDTGITQGHTTMPLPLKCNEDMEVEKACPVCFSLWKGYGLQNVGEAEELFAKVCHEADINLGELGGVRHLFHWVDDTPREEMRRELLLEVQREIRRREELQHVA